jgi:hypothetical protein
MELGVIHSIPTAPATDGVLCTFYPQSYPQHYNENFSTPVAYMRTFVVYCHFLVFVYNPTHDANKTNNFPD